MDLYHVRISVVLTDGKRIKLHVIAAANPESVQDRLRNRLLKTGDRVKEFGKQELLHFYPSTQPVDGTTYENECAELLERAMAQAPE